MKVFVTKEALDPYKEVLAYERESLPPGKHGGGDIRGNDA